jgi:hypothetical protein
MKGRQVGQGSGVVQVFPLTAGTCGKPTANINADRLQPDLNSIMLAEPQSTGDGKLLAAMYVYLIVCIALIKVVLLSTALVWVVLTQQAV